MRGDSRARGDGAPDADWDIGIVGPVDIAGLAADLTAALGTDDVDLVHLDRASALLRFRAARDGVPLPTVKSRLARAHAMLRERNTPRSAFSPQSRPSAAT